MGFDDRDSRRTGGVRPVISPLGTPLTLEDLPPPGTRRWVIRRKAEVVAGVRAGLLTLEEACERYNLSVEEFLSWQRMLERHGMRGLRTTRLQQYRQPSEKSEKKDDGNSNGDNSALPPRAASR